MMLKLIGKVLVLSLSVLAVSSFPWLEQANAVDLSSGEVEARLDTTISYGTAFRVEEQDKDLIEGLSAVNRNDGALNYKRGIVSNAVKFTSNLNLAYRNFGLFLGATGFFDAENENGTRARTPLSPEAKALVGKDIDLLDAYVTGAFDIGDTAVDVRVGKHVLNWGESTFIQSGINVINPFDVSKLRVPGAELREALVPVPLVSAAAELPGNLSLEGFYQLDWQETVIDPVGTYFSITDYAGPGAKKAVIPISTSISDLGHGFGPLTPAINADLAAASLPAQPDFDRRFMSVERDPDAKPRDAGQWGMAVRYLAEELNNTEFGFYYVNYHSRLPTLAAHQGSTPGLLGGLGAAGAIAGGNAVTGAIDAQATPAVREAVMQAVQAGLIDPAGAQRAIEEQVRKKVAEGAGGIAQLLAIDRFAKTGYYNIEYADDIQLLGLSFNTQLGNLGWALQGEYSLRIDAPLQRKEENLIAEGLGPIFAALRLSAQDPAAVPGYVGAYTPTKVPGFIRAKISQVQATATKVFGPALGADSWVFVTEAALMRVHDMPEEEIETSALGDTADATSFGYRMAARLDYNNAIGAVNLFPYLQFRHDIKGNSPGPGRPFVEGLTGLTLGLRADYLSRWQGVLSYTRFSGSRNKLRDRDFVTATIKYSF